jgi:hypothetical protein
MAQPGGLDRRGFLAAGGAATFLCTIAGETVKVASPDDVARVDAAAAALPRPAAAERDPVDSAQFVTPDPQPGGTRREYWIGARTITWDIVPKGRDEWMKRRPPRRSRRRISAYVYQQFSPGFASPIGPARMPGPTLYAEVGDVIVVHFSNLDRRLRQAVTVHPHGVRPARSSHTFGRPRRTRLARGPTTTMAQTTRSTLCAACSAR